MRAIFSCASFPSFCTGVYLMISSFIDIYCCWLTAAQNLGFDYRLLLIFIKGKNRFFHPTVSPWHFIDYLYYLCLARHKFTSFLLDLNQVLRVL